MFARCIGIKDISEITCLSINEISKLKQESWNSV